MSVYLELCEILGISLNEFLAGEDIEVTNVEKKSEDTLIQISKDSSHKQRYLKKIIAVLLIAVGVFAITLGIMVCNKLRQPQNYIEAVDPDSVEMKTAELLSGIDGTMMFRYNSKDTFQALYVYLSEYHSGKQVSHKRVLELSYEDVKSAKNGLIVITRANHIETFRPYLENGPIVFCEDASGTDVPFVMIDQVGSVTASILYLKEQGVKRLGLTLGRSKRLSCNSINTIAKAKELFPGFSEEDIFWDCIKAEDGEAAAVFFKDRGVDGIITNGDEIAATILSQYGERKAPLIIGQENLLFSRLLNFSTVEFHLHLCGREAFRLFQERSREQIVLPFELLVRS